MKVLWITNIAFPAVCKDLGLKEPVVGGWMYSSAKALLNIDSSIGLAVATIYNGDKFEKRIIDKIVYYMIPLNGSNIKYHKELESLWSKINEEFKPDIVHLHGTEFAHGLAFLNACPDVKSVVSIQGLVSVCSRYYYAGISSCDILKNITFRDIAKCDSLFQQKRTFYNRGLIEEQIIKKTKNIIGRTSWDKYHSLAINENLKYYSCNETLRSIFYEKKWSYANCEKHSIFMSQVKYPIKGLHQVIKALLLILLKYPDTKIYVAGNNIIANGTIKQKIKISGYAKYIKSLLKKNNLMNKVVFTGFLNENEICDYYLRSNIFICPSSIENSPNSLGEAQLLGVPCIASYVGGIPDMMKGAEDKMYRFEEFEMLAGKVCDIFKLKDKVETEALQKQSLQRHNKKNNAMQLLTIYKDLLN